ncbi:hypothetical protein LZK73_30850 (plasmid) [Neorhizobium galegae]|nr:hypothetical protein LZK73_30850 [Neorhizobium galegae]
MSPRPFKATLAKLPSFDGAASVAVRDTPTFQAVAIRPAPAPRQAVPVCPSRPPPADPAPAREPDVRQGLARKGLLG